jgi:hypothetical protein
MRVAVVVLTWNDKDETLRCLASLRSACGPGDAVVVVDNGSEDGTEAAVRSAHPWVTFLQNGENRGFAGGNNAGLRWALARGCRWVFLLNNDTVVEPDTLERLVAFGESRPGVGAVQPLLVALDDPQRIDSCGHLVQRTIGARDLCRGAPLHTAPREPRSVFGACGAAALLRAPALQAAGLLDESLFVLAEDVDLMFRIRLAGYDIQLLPDVRVRHARGISAHGLSRHARRLRRFWLQRNLVALALRYWPRSLLLAHLPLLLLRILQALILLPSLSGERCLPVWWKSLTMRRAARAAMRRCDLDRWFGMVTV